METTAMMALAHPYAMAMRTHSERTAMAMLLQYNTEENILIKIRIKIRSVLHTGWFLRFRSETRTIPIRALTLRTDHRLSRGSRIPSMQTAKAGELLNHIKHTACYILTE